ncbi:MAG: hypothetical protein LBD10_07035 [Desulfobulbus sp.]|jgi:hypothetical protein|uniref:hypothetical protein n=1 Tax=Desulfobulbus sp. TaxID=895 RepID=UPI00284A16BD|nr:hypothetical protein [Desulfobulbus sp.]MDR2549934.1 hypothetical protein [Desulfobulbus sp.]
MNKLLNTAIMALMAVTLISCAQHGTPGAATQEAPAQDAKASALDIQRSTARSTTATVEAVDLKTRMVKLRSFEGRLFDIHVGKEAVNLNQVRRGDTVEITYAQELEVRMAEPGEVLNDVTRVIGNAEPGAKPRGIGVTEAHVTATIMDIDKTGESVLLKFADGVVTSVKVQNPANLDKVKVGDTIAITYIEAIDIVVKSKKR